jgi:hypothetical protein
MRKPVCTRDDLQDKTLKNMELAIPLLPGDLAGNNMKLKNQQRKTTFRHTRFAMNIHRVGCREPLGLATPSPNRETRPGAPVGLALHLAYRLTFIAAKFNLSNFHAARFFPFCVLIVRKQELPSVRVHRRTDTPRPDTDTCFGARYAADDRLPIGKMKTILALKSLRGLHRGTNVEE